MGNPAPPGLNNDKGRVAGAFGSLRIGYRFSTNWAVEFMGENTGHEIGACVASGGTCTTAKGNYTFSSTRIGPAMRLMSNGRKGRFVGTVGLRRRVRTIKYDTALNRRRPETQKTKPQPAPFLQLGGLTSSTSVTFCSTPASFSRSRRPTSRRSVSEHRQRRRRDSRRLRCVVSARSRR
jgi:hypothetical protein